VTTAGSPGEVEPRLSGRGLRVVRGPRAILRDVDLEVRAGEVVGILGPSGAGKSTLFRALMGDLDIDAGSVRLDGRDITRWPLWRRARAGVGYIPQEPSVLWDLTVRQNLVAFQRIAERSPAEPGSSVRRAAETVGLEERLDVRAGELSAGERRRLEFARAITLPGAELPRVLICDEPFAGVDPGGAAHLGKLLADMAVKGAAVLLADHHVAEALRVCTRAVLLLDGTVATSATPAAFREDPVVKLRYLAEWDATGEAPAPPPEPPASGGT
jgi:lipopolysaccharide export system ATP-binding protein